MGREWPRVLCARVREEGKMVAYVSGRNREEGRRNAQLPRNQQLELLFLEPAVPVGRRVCRLAVLGFFGLPIAGCGRVVPAGAHARRDRRVAEKVECGEVGGGGDFGGALGGGVGGEGGGVEGEEG